MLKKAVPFLIIGSIITAMVMFIILKSESVVEGRVYTIEGTDTLYLQNVNVTLNISDPNLADEGAPNFNARYRTETDSSGYFAITITIVPYESDYYMSFSKADYATNNMWRHYRFSKDVYFNIEMKKGSGIAFLPPLEFDESGTESKRSSDDRYENGLMVFLLLGIVSLFLIWRYFPFILVVDWFRNLSNRGFKGLSKSKKTALLKEGFCDSCKDYMGMTFEGEETEMGMTFIHGTCASCGGPIKVRMN